MERAEIWNIPRQPLTGLPLGPELQRRLVIELNRRLPPTWPVGPASFSRSPLGPDGWIEIGAPGYGSPRVRIPIEAKGRLDPSDVPTAVARARRAAPDGGPVIVGAPFLSPRTRDLLAQAGAGYADLTGNVRVQAERPPLFIELHGRDTDPWPDTRPLRSLKGSAAGRVVRALCDFRAPISVRGLAGRSRTPVGTVSRVVNLIEREALLTRGARGGVQDVRWADLLRRWARDYSFQGSNRVAAYLEPRGLSALHGKLSGGGWTYALTGSLAASDLAPIAPPRLAMLYAEEPEALAGGLGLRPAESGANVLLAAPFDPVVFDRPRRRDGLVCVAPSQAVVDLLTGPGRSPSEAEALLGWMDQHEDAWRS